MMLTKGGSSFYIVTVSVSEYPCRAQIKHTEQMAGCVQFVMCVAVNNYTELLKGMYGLQSFKSPDCLAESVRSEASFRFLFRALSSLSSTV